jgi:hypothetical protein
MGFLLSLRRSVERRTSAPLLASEHEQLSVDGKQLGDGVLEAAGGIDSRADSVDPLSGNGLDVLLAIDHKSQ